jgi:hypothetical protein
MPDAYAQFAKAAEALLARFIKNPLVRKALAASATAAFYAVVQDLASRRRQA